jgi:hypothetical protein
MVLDKKFITPYTQNWNLTIEREVLANTLLRIGYVGTKGTHLTAFVRSERPDLQPEPVLEPESGDGQRAPTGEGFPGDHALDARAELELSLAAGNGG